MTRIVLLDESPLAAIVHPSTKGINGESKVWFQDLTKAGVSVRIPQIADYELRRELILQGFGASIALLNQLIRSTGGIVPITSRTMTKAAEFWAKRRKENLAAREDKSLDGDMILCAQAWLLAGLRRTVIVATSNVKDLKDFVDCDEWQNIKP